MLKYSNTLLVVSDINRSIEFYEEVIGDRIAMDFGENVVFESGLSLQESKLWKKFIHDAEVGFGGNDAELYFTEDDFDGFIEYLGEFDGIKYVHRAETTAWGQRVVRFYDPDMHIIEVGEDMDCVIRRMLAEGMTPEQAAEKSQFPIEYVERLMK